MRIDEVIPNEGTYTGGTHLHVIGEGFSVDTYGGSNEVLIGDPSYDYFINPALAPNWQGAYAPCDVIEGACTVDCKYT